MLSKCSTQTRHVFREYVFNNLLQKLNSARENFTFLKFSVKNFLGRFYMVIDEFVSIFCNTRRRIQNNIVRIKIRKKIVDHEKSVHLETPRNTYGGHVLETLNIGTLQSTTLDSL